jgi:hypothetical protein
MAARKRGAKNKAKVPKRVRRTFVLEQDKLDLARKALELPTDAEVIRFALDHLLSHFGRHHGEEE